MNRLQLDPESAVGIIEHSHLDAVLRRLSLQDGTGLRPHVLRGRLESCCGLKMEQEGDRTRLAVHEVVLVGRDGEIYAGRDLSLDVGSEPEAAYLHVVRRRNRVGGRGSPFVVRAGRLELSGRPTGGSGGCTGSLFARFMPRAHGTVNRELDETWWPNTVCVDSDPRSLREVRAIPGIVPDLPADIMFLLQNSEALTWRELLPPLLRLQQDRCAGSPGMQAELLQIALCSYEAEIWGRLRSMFARSGLPTVIGQARFQRAVVPADVSMQGPVQTYRFDAGAGLEADRRDWMFWLGVRVAVDPGRRTCEGRLSSQARPAAVYRRPIGDRECRLVGQIESRHFEFALDGGELVSAGIYRGVPN